jgi:hypothetical protein
VGDEGDLVDQAAGGEALELVAGLSWGAGDGEALD